MSAIYRLWNFVFVESDSDSSSSMVDSSFTPKPRRDRPICTHSGLLIVIHPTVQTAPVENVFTIGQLSDLFSYLEVVQTYGASPPQTASPNFITDRISRIRTADASEYSSTCVCVSNHKTLVSKKSERPRK
ncbi:hypothetical protein CK203_091236 [Vitis vinifera]|uniref:Uncharacterized protein n=1 Tax=Vitis vinifera TaxID=29760 RepID=A0A438EMF3_VITVI|nr:hypothetical protein CK203_091236 [Vitis vinifera]